MRPIQDLLMQSNLQSQKSSTQSSQALSDKLNVTPTGLNLTEKVFAELSLIYTWRWKAQHSTAEMWEAAKREWAIELVKLDHEKIRQALDACRKIDDVPILPKFLALAGVKQESGYSCHRLYKPARAKRADNPSPLLQEYMKKQVMGNANGS